MKTAYIKPQTEILNINVEPMMAASLPTTVSNTETNTYAAKENSFGFDVWGSDDEE